MKFVLVFLWVSLIVASNATAGIPASVLIDGKPVVSSRMNLVQEIIVDQSLRQPDQCKLLLLNPGADGWKPAAGSSLDIQVQSGDATGAIFEGEVVGVEPIFKSGGQSTALLVRGFDKSHRLSRGVRTRIWRQISEADLFAAIVASYDLRFEVEDPGFQSEFVHQNNQTDLDFLRERAARIGFVLDVQGDVLRVASPASLFPAPVPLKSFRPLEFIDRDNPGPVHVVVRGWDPVNKAQITGEATEDSSQAGPGTTYEFEADELAEEPGHSDLLVFSGVEVEAITQARLLDRIRQSVTAAVATVGNPKIKPGIVVVVDSNDDRFNGKYFVSGVTHRFSKRGYTTTIRFSRDSEKGS